MTKIEILKEITAIIEAYSDITEYDVESVLRDLHALRDKIHKSNN